MDQVMMDYLERKMYGDRVRGNQGGNYDRGPQGNWDGGYPMHDQAGYPRMDCNEYARGDMNYPMYGDMNYPVSRGDMLDQRGYYVQPVDHRQGVKGTGPYGIGGSMYYGSRDRNDGPNYNHMGDQHKFKMPKLTKAEKHQWEQMMQNTDGTRGPHYDMQQVIQAAEKLGIRFNQYDEKDLALVMNMFYSDYGQVFKKYMPAEKLEMFCADMAKAYFDDPDGPDPDDKLSRQFHCMTDHD